MLCGTKAYASSIAIAIALLAFPERSDAAQTTAARGGTEKFATHRISAESRSQFRALVQRGAPSGWTMAKVYLHSRGIPVSTRNMSPGTTKVIGYARLAGTLYLHSRGIHVGTPNTAAHERIKLINYGRLLHAREKQANHLGSALLRTATAAQRALDANRLHAFNRDARRAVIIAHRAQHVLNNTNKEVSAFLRFVKSSGVATNHAAVGSAKFTVGHSSAAGLGFASGYRGHDLYGRLHPASDRSPTDGNLHLRELSKANTPTFLDFLLDLARIVSDIIQVVRGVGEIVAGVATTLAGGVGIIAIIHGAVDTFSGVRSLIDHVDKTVKDYDRLQATPSG